jgi:ABC-type phosphate transport system substrate-binding protein
LKELQEENKQDPDAEDKKSPEQVAEIIDEAIKAWEQERIEADKQALEDDPVLDEKSRREAIEEAMRT